METEKRQSLFNRKGFIKLLFFVGAVVLTIYFFPREEKFRYHFQEGKPWKYGLLTAPFDFPIYKSEEVVKHEQDSILQAVSLYFSLETTQSILQIEAWKNSYADHLHTVISPALFQLVERSLQTIYQKGVVSASEYDKLKKEGKEEIMLLENDVAKPVALSNLFSVRTAYEYIMDAAGNDSDKHQLQNCNLNNFIVENLQYDSVVTEKVKQELLQKIAVSCGMVQTGERIIDRGEIVSPQTYHILHSFETVSLKKNVYRDKFGLSLLGQTIVVCALFTFLYLFMKLFRWRMFTHLNSVLFVLLMIVGITMVSYIAIDFRVLGIYLVPFAILPIIVCTFLDSRVALYSGLIAILLSAFAAPFPLEFIFLQVMVAMAAIYSLRDLVKRSQLVRCSIIVFCTYCICYVGYTLVVEGDWSKVNMLMFLYFAINSVLLLFAYLLIYLLEKMFGFISNVTLVELSDINSPILRQLSENCPGTFQHSLQVSNLAAEAANKIGANAQLVRTGALYHDIGKLANPAFFTENQSGGINPHDKLTYEQSAQIIISHVKDGVKIADRIQLPPRVKDFIVTHHGKSKTKYFYNSFKNKYPDKEIKEELFTYPGPNPHTKETAILMMADSVEAASRSLKEYTEASISQLVENIINGQIMDNLLKDTPLSFRDIETIKQVFIEKLKTIYHTRISYPELKV